MPSLQTQPVGWNKALSKFTDDTCLGEQLMCQLMCRAIIQSILNKLEWNFFKFSTGQYKFLIMQQERLGTNWLQSSTAWKVLGVPVGKRAPMWVSSASWRSTPSWAVLASMSKLRKVILCPLFGTSKTLPGGLCSVLDSPLQNWHWHTTMSLLEDQVAGAHGIHGEVTEKGFFCLKVRIRGESNCFHLPIGNVQVRWSQTLLGSAPQ